MASLTVRQVEFRLNQIANGDGPQAVAASEILARPDRGAGFVAAYEGLGTQFQGDAGGGLNRAVARFDVAPRFTADQTALESSLVQAVNLEGDRGEKVTNITPSLELFV